MSDQAIGSIVMTGMILFYIIIGFIIRKVGRGYNSLSRAMASMEAQNFAARYCGGKLILLSAIAAIPTIVLTIFMIVLHENETLTQIVFWVSLTVSLAIPLVAIILTEIKLRRHFDKNGRPYK